MQTQKLLASAFLVACAAFSSNTLHGGSLALNFHYASSGGQLVSSGTSIDGIDNWTNVKLSGSAMTSRSTQSLTDGAGYWFTTPSYWQPVNYGISGNSTNSATGSTAVHRATLDSTYDKGIWTGYSCLIQFTGLNAWMTANNYASYTLVLYTATTSYDPASGNDNPLGIFELHSGNFSTTTETDFYNNSGDTIIGDIAPTYIQDTDPSKPKAAYSTSYLGGLTEDSIMLAAPQFDRATGHDGGIAGIALVGVAIPEPSTYALGAGLIALGVAVLIRRRGKK